METGEVQEGGTVKRKDLRDIYGKIARPDVIGDLGSVTMSGLFCLYTRVLLPLY